MGGAALQRSLCCPPARSCWLREALLSGACCCRGRRLGLLLLLLLPEQPPPPPPLPPMQQRPQLGQLQEQAQVQRMQSWQRLAAQC